VTGAEQFTFADLLERAVACTEEEFVALVDVPVLVATGTLALRVASGENPRSTGVIELPSAVADPERLRNDPQHAKIHIVRRRDRAVGPLRVGRTGQNDIAIDDSSLSRHHASLEVRGDVVVVIDLGSRNGTFLREERLEPTKPAEARSEDLLRFGRVSLQLYEPAALYQALRLCV